MSENVKHTPGPWSIPHFARSDDEWAESNKKFANLGLSFGNSRCDCAYVLCDHYAGSICDISINNGKAICDGGNDAPPLEEAKANARLIAAAPTLLSLLKRFVKRLHDGDCQFTDKADKGCYLCRVAEEVLITETRAAIAKAEGREP